MRIAGLRVKKIGKGEGWGKEGGNWEDGGLGILGEGEKDDKVGLPALALWTSLHGHLERLSGREKGDVHCTWTPSNCRGSTRGSDVDCWVDYRSFDCGSFVHLIVIYSSFYSVMFVERDLWRTGIIILKVAVAARTAAHVTRVTRICRDERKFVASTQRGERGERGEELTERRGKPGCFTSSINS